MAGCDSVIHIDLFIHDSSTSFQEVDACYTYLSPSGLHNWNSSGVYLDTLVNAAGCDSILSIDLSILSVDSSIYVVGNTMVSNASLVDYQWFECSGDMTPVPGAVEQTFTPMVSGNYAVVVTSPQGCVDTSACMEMIITNAEELLSKGLEIYPNPTNGNVHIKWSSQLSAIHLMDYLGNLVAMYPTGNLREMDITLPEIAGLYFVSTWIDGQCITMLPVVRQ